MTKISDELLSCRCSGMLFQKEEWLVLAVYDVRGSLHHEFKFADLRAKDEFVEMHKLLCASRKAVRV